jgi:hypothetical protein
MEMKYDQDPSSKKVALSGLQKIMNNKFSVHIDSRSSGGKNSFTLIKGKNYPSQMHEFFLGGKYSNH